MRKSLFLAVGIALTALAISKAWAGCPAGTSYQCYQGAGNKVICGCR